jgi:hypothetical protein
MDAMGDRYRAPGGWTVEVIHLSGTPDKRDGEWIRVRYFGFHVADVRSVTDLGQWFALADLEPEALALAASHPDPNVGSGVLDVLRHHIGGERWDSNPRHPGPQPGALTN